MDKFNLIRFNDDNHAERIFVNGKFLGTLADIEYVLKNFIQICNVEKADEIESTSIYVCDDFDEIDEDMVDDIWEWFNHVEKMTYKEIELVKNKNWLELYKEINK